MDILGFDLGKFIIIKVRMGCMKRKIIIFISIINCLLIGTLIFFKNRQPQSNEINEQMYFIGNDENETYSKILYAIAPLSYSGQLNCSFEMGDKLGVIEEIVDYIPYYPMNINPNQDNCVSFIAIIDGEKYNVWLEPELINLENGSQIEYIQNTHVFTYISEDYFTATNKIFKKLSNDSGIYITREFFRYHQLPIPKQSMSLEVIVSVPKSFYPKNVHNETLYNQANLDDNSKDLYIVDYISYEIEGYVEVKKTFEIEGVVDDYQQYNGISITLPKEESNEIISMINDQTITPSMYAIMISNEFTIDEVGDILDEYLDRFSIIDDLNNRRIVVD